MRADADEAARRFAAENIAAPAAALFQGFARVLGGDLDAGDAYLEHAISIGDVGAPDVLAHALCERSLVAMTRGHWTRAEALADDARTVLRRAMIEDSDATAAGECRCTPRRARRACAAPRQRRWRRSPRSWPGATRCAHRPPEPRPESSDHASSRPATARTAHARAHSGAPDVPAMLIACSRYASPPSRSPPRTRAKP